MELNVFVPQDSFSKNQKVQKINVYLVQIRMLLHVQMIYQYLVNKVILYSTKNLRNLIVDAIISRLLKLVSINQKVVCVNNVQIHLQLVVQTLLGLRYSVQEI